MGIPMLKIRTSQDHLIFNMGILILVRRHLYNEMGPRSLPEPMMTQISYAYMGHQAWMGLIKWMVKHCQVPFITHWGLNKLSLSAWNLHTIFWNTWSWMKIILLWLKFYSWASNAALVQVMTWCWWGWKGLTEQMMTKTYDTIWHY